MATIFNNIDKVAGEPLVSVIVNIVLSWDKNESAVATVTDEETMIRGTYGTETDVDGRWEINLVSNDEITPEDSVYKITERITSTNETTIYYVSVPNSATPTSWVGDILVAKPSWED